MCVTAFATYQWVTANPGCETGVRCARVLFLGNSYTSVNDLPDTLARLAWSGGHRMVKAAQASSPGLWQDDGSHPTGKGTYLAACVFYAAIFGESPAGLGWHPWISNGDAYQVQRTSAATVLDDRLEWGLP